ncbi:Tfp pilus assembly protein PilN [Bacillus alveayuensis]|uniref:Tfp pilus assembly protein PilN n=1 Tax=Aeribacillus alveayuensis TaxID=279215 RepID=A0ABT9VKT9_9BACI|nr:Tfp pilus assembly protein PilN [Bacillus alveayuensis]
MKRQNWMLLGVFVVVCLLWGVGYWLYIVN